MLGLLIAMVFSRIYRPNQDLSLIHDYLTDKLTGHNSPKLHLVAFDASNEISGALSKMALALKGHFHSYNSSTSKSSDSSSEDEVRVVTKQSL